MQLLFKLCVFFEMAQVDLKLQGSTLHKLSGSYSFGGLLVKVQSNDLY